MRGEVNQAYENDYGEATRKANFVTGIPPSNNNDKNLTKEDLILDEANSDHDRAQWGNGLEFLMSCIAMSVGLGNIWRFPFTAYENGGGAFLIPYIIILILIGRPLYYMEMILGQFSARGPTKMYVEVSPGFVGVGYGQMIATLSVATYYCSLMALTLYYLCASFAAELPWAYCSNEWGDICFDSAPEGGTHSNATNRTSSSELYFIKTVLREKDNIDDGIGMPDLRLTICLFLSWCSVFIVSARGVKSSGKAAYFLALFPYVVMFALLIRALTLPGAGDGIIFFIKPQWDKLLLPQVWYAAVTQAFFSLNICFGAIIMYSSYNNFDHNINRDAMIVTTLDTFTSLLAGATIFGILGNLAHESGINIREIVKGGTGLAFISYPDAIAKFTWAPQFFAVLFFLMLFILGIGSLVALHSNLVTCIKDQFPKLADWHIGAGLSVVGFLIGLIYVTPGGQFMLNLVDYFGGTFIVFVLAIFEIACISWIYGLNNFCFDVEFMLNIKVSLYWRLCWGIFSPGLLIFILIYTLATIAPLQYKDVDYPDVAIVAGWLLLIFGIIQLPIWACWSLWKYKTSSAFSATEKWGPKNSKQNQEWRQFKVDRKQQEMFKQENCINRTISTVLCQR